MTTNYEYLKQMMNPKPEPRPCRLELLLRKAAVDFCLVAVFVLSMAWAAGCFA